MKEWQQKLFPQHTLSKLLGRLANAKLGVLTTFFIKQFVKSYRVNLSEAQVTDPAGFESFNAFFTRALKPGARSMKLDHNCLLSPVDGAISEIGAIEQDRLLQAKGAYFSLTNLCGGDKTLASCFENGAFLTAYLSPKDYHRFHMPISGRLLEMVYVPGSLFSVNRSSVKNVPGLFARNERVICVFETEIGKVAMIAVGAMVVGSVEMRFHGVVAPQENRVIKRWSYDDKTIQFAQGDELGCFRLGSTIIVLCEKDRVNWASHLKSDAALLLGDVIGDLTKRDPKEM